MRRKQEEYILKKVAFINDTYNAYVEVYIGEQDDFMSYLFERNIFSEEDLDGMHRDIMANAGTSWMMSTSDGKRPCGDIFMVYMQSFKMDDIENLTTLSHEMLHVAINIGISRGLTLNVKEDSEVIAYLHTSLYRTVLVKLNGKMKRTGEKPLDGKIQHEKREKACSDA